jgi:hypothetical protein
MVDPKPTWPRRLPVCRFVGLGLSLLCGVLAVRVWMRHAPVLESFYMPRYLELTVLPELPRLPQKGMPTSGWRQYQVLFVGRLVATEEPTVQSTGRLSIREVPFTRQGFADWLQDHIYGGRTVAEVLAWPLRAFGCALLILVGTGFYLDREHDAIARNGRLLRGPGVLSRWQFNRRTRGLGLRLRLANARNPFEWLQGDRGKDLVIPANREAHHIQIAGDTGTGKSTLIRQIIRQVEERGEVAILFDPDREYIQEFFNEKRGDWVLNPKDERCPYWPIGDEADDEAEATPIAMGLFPDAPTRQQFFLSHTRAIFAYLLAAYKPTVNQLAYWMAHPEEIDKRVKGTEHEHTLTANAAPQRAGILGSLNEAGKPLRMMPSDPAGRRRWTVRDWVNDRRGWLFITSTPNTIDALRPMQSLWLDMLILSLQSSENDLEHSRVWLILDELASVNALPQLQTAMTKQRKSGNPIVLGFQSMAQVADAYGDKKAETILSQAFTNIILRTREPRAAEHLSNLIGKAQLERARETKPAQFSGGRHRSYSTERVIDPVVMDSQIQTLNDLRGYFVQQDKVVAIRFQPTPKRKVAPALLERIIPAQPHRPLDPAETPATASGTSGSVQKSVKTAKEVVLEQQHSLGFDIAS